MAGQVRAPYRSAHIFFSSAVPPHVLDAIRGCPLLVGALRSLKEVRTAGPHPQPTELREDCAWRQSPAASTRRASRGDLRSRRPHQGRGSEGCVLPQCQI